MTPQIVKKFFLITLSLLCLLNSVARDVIDDGTDEGGHWSGAGGQGVVCFADRKSRKEFEKTYEQTNQISEAHLISMQSVQTLDYFSARRSLDFESLQKLAQQKGDIAVVQEFVNRFKPWSSNFIQKYEVASRVLPFSAWKATRTLPLTDDAFKSGISKFFFRWKLGSKCSLVQLAIRKTESRLMEKSTVYYQPDLYKKLDSFNRALLKIHETVYLLAQNESWFDDLSGEVSDSVHVRNLVTFSLSQKFPDSIQKYKNFEQAQGFVDTFVHFNLVGYMTPAVDTDHFDNDDFMNDLHGVMAEYRQMERENAERDNRDNANDRDDRNSRDDGDSRDHPRHR